LNIKLHEKHLIKKNGSSDSRVVLCHSANKCCNMVICWSDEIKISLSFLMSFQ
jgi:hypothetical protein